MKKRRSAAAVSLLLVSGLSGKMPCSAAEQETAGLYINEVCTQNKSCFTDSLGKASDWIELYNGGNAELGTTQVLTSTSPIACSTAKSLTLVTTPAVSLDTPAVAI